LFCLDCYISQRPY